jgi:hypothetical protein
MAAIFIFPHLHIAFRFNPVEDPRNIPLPSQLHFELQFASGFLMIHVTTFSFHPIAILTVILPSPLSYFLGLLGIYLELQILLLHQRDAL